MKPQKTLKIFFTFCNCLVDVLTDCGQVLFLEENKKKLVILFGERNWKRKHNNHSFLVDWNSSTIKEIKKLINKKKIKK